MYNFEGFKEKFPYRVSLLRTKVGMDEVVDFYNLLSHHTDNSLYIGNGYYTCIYQNEAETVGYFLYTQRSSSFWDQVTVGFTTRKEMTEFKKQFALGLKK